jgi:hypothetical protein
VLNIADRVRLRARAAADDRWHAARRRWLTCSRVLEQYSSAAGHRAVSNDLLAQNVLEWTAQCASSTGMPRAAMPSSPRHDRGDLWRPRPQRRCRHHGEIGDTAIERLYRAAYRLLA